MRLAERLQEVGLPADGDLAFSADAAVQEGERAHYARGAVLQTDDADLALLAGDHLYALGLADLADRGDLDGAVEHFRLGAADGDDLAARALRELGG